MNTSIPAPTPAETADRLASASEHYRQLATNPACIDFDAMLCAQDEVTMCRCQLAAAGRLDLIGGA